MRTHIVHALADWIKSISVPDAVVAITELREQIGDALWCAITGQKPRPVWETEPNQRDFEHAGFQCHIMRTRRMGHLCGYVDVPEGHPWYGLGYDAITGVDVHGGLTYARATDNVWRIGFDCGHAGDLIPGMVELYGPRDYGDIYRTIGYVEAECRKLAEQAAAAPYGSRSEP